MQAVKMLLFKAFSLIVKPLTGTGITRFHPIGATYRYLAGILMPTRQHLISVNGYKMLVPMEKDRAIDSIAQQLLFKGTYEQYTTALFKQLVKKGMTVIDAGAHIGYFTLLAASLVGEKGKVFAFEPEPRNYAILVKNIELNGYKNVIPHQKAVSNKAGKVKLFLGTAPGTNSLFKVGETTTASIIVDVVSIDEFFKDNECPIDVIKMDVQGAEVAALLGMAKIVECNNNLKIFTEFWPYGLQQAGFSSQEYWSNLIQSGFKYIYLINDNKQKIETANLEAITRYCQRTRLKELTSVNLLCSKSPVD